MEPPCACPYLLGSSATPSNITYLRELPGNSYKIVGPSVTLYITHSSGTYLAIRGQAREH